jgi:integrative and conjugative element protein (TIGR02256 family)
MGKAERSFWSRDGRYGLTIGDKEIERLVQLCQKVNNRETGGIVVGFYEDSLKCAVVSHISDPPTDSRSGYAWFRRGKKGLARWLRHLWNSNHHYYLGEWHYHPDGSIDSSPTDRNQMFDIARSPNYACPKPLLIIVGGLLPMNPQFGVYVFLDDGNYLKLFPDGDKADA